MTHIWAQMGYSACILPNITKGLEQGIALDPALLFYILTAQSPRQADRRYTR